MDSSRLHRLPLIVSWLKAFPIFLLNKQLRSYDAFLSHLGVSSESFTSYSIVCSPGGDARCGI